MKPRLTYRWHTWYCILGDFEGVGITAKEAWDNMWKQYDYHIGRRGL